MIDRRVTYNRELKDNQGQAMTTKPPAPKALAPMTQDRLLDRTLAANQIVDKTSGGNPYEMRNQLLTR